MSTRSMIAFENSDGSIDAIYCHWDGYPEGVGQTLLDNYQDVSKVKQLISLGDLSSLGKTVGVDPLIKRYGFDYCANPDFYNLPMEMQSSLLDNQIGSVAYHRDRGESLKISHYNNLASFTRHLDLNIEYAYVYRIKAVRDNHWQVRTIYDEWTGWKPVDRVIKQITAA